MVDFEKLKSDYVAREKAAWAEFNLVQDRAKTKLEADIAAAYQKFLSDLRQAQAAGE